MEYMSIVKPFLKWIGGKTQIIETILTRFPTAIQNYYEPFLGGGSVLFGLLSSRRSGKITLSGTIYASDLNSNLIGLYQTIQRDPNALIAEVHALIEEFSSCADTGVNRAPHNVEEALTSRESYYFWIRTRFNAMTQAARMTPQGSAMLLFLNKTCFRGMYREGPNGFNVPFGNYKNPEIINYEHLKYVSNLIQPVNFIHSSFENSFTKFNKEDFKEDFVYLDPPYAPETEKSFVGYTADGFSLEQHNLLFKLMKESQENQVKFLMSNADVDLVKNSFSNPIYTIEIISCKRSINSKKPNSKTNEVLITNF